MGKAPSVIFISQNELVTFFFFNGMPFLRERMTDRQAMVRQTFSKKQMKLDSDLKKTQTQLKRFAVHKKI